MLGWKIGGEAGYGIMSAGAIFAKTCTRLGSHVFATNDYPSLIRGGHNTYTVRVEQDKEIGSHLRIIDLLVALNEETIALHKDELTHGGGIIFDADKIDIKKFQVRPDIKLFHVPMFQLATEAGEKKVVQNTVAIGASCALLDCEREVVYSVIKDIFKKKGEKVIAGNIAMIDAGYNYVKQHYSDFAWKLQKTSAERRIILTGNEAISAGAIKAGCKFVSIYPMTPTSNILHFMADKELDYNIVVKQPEDEIAAINFAIGASHVGVRAMTATSGGGFSLMVESLGLAGMTETPLVVVEGQRGGPSTGLPTKTEQGDLRFVMHASQSDYPRIIIAPGDVDECFYETFHAFNIADKYQCPVILIVDKLVCESMKSTKPFAVSHLQVDRGHIVTEKDLEGKDYQRFAITESGISPRALPGTKHGIFMATSDEHTEYGLYTEEVEVRQRMMDKRMRKLETFKREMPLPRLYGDNDAGLTIISWGSNKQAILEAMQFLKQNDAVAANFMHLVYVFPFPAEFVADVLKKAGKTVIIEANYSGQMQGLIKEYTGKDIEHHFRKYDGTPFTSDEIYMKLKEVLRG